MAQKFHSNFLFLFISFLLFTQCTPTPKYDFLLLNGTIIDGLGEPGFQGSIAVKEDKIVLVSKEKIKENLANQVIDASGLIIAPGFIDLHTNITTDIQDYPLAENFIRQGSTTLLASLHSGEQPYPLKAYAENLEMAPNMVYFSGHSWIRSKVIGDENREPTAPELEEMKKLVQEAMEDGAVGLATGLEYVPANFAKTEEVIALAQVAAKYKGAYFTHMRNEGGQLMESIRESIRIGAEAEIPVQINHLKAAGSTQWGWSRQVLALLDSARSVGITVSQDIYPYTAYSTYSYLMLPRWAMSGGRAALIKRCQDPSTLAKIKAEMAEIIKKDAGGADLSLLQFRTFDQDTAFTGKTLKDYALAKGLEPNLENGIDLLLELEQAGGFTGIFHAMAEEDLIAFIQDPHTMFDSDGDLLNFEEGHPHPRCYGAFPRILGYFVREKKVISLEEAIKRMTSLSADRIFQTQRGRIQEGAFADLVLFDFEQIGDQSSYTDPHHFPTGIEHVLVNGQLVFSNGEMTGAKPGQWLKKP